MPLWFNTIGQHRPAAGSLRGAMRCRIFFKPAAPGFCRGKADGAASRGRSFYAHGFPEAAKGDFPFGAVIVRESEVLAKGRNLGKTNNDPTAHGEMVAIRNFVAERPAQEFANTTLYTSGEPCAMCISAIIWCGIARVVFAASVEELATRIGQIMLASRTVANAAPFADIAITGGVLSSEALALFPK